MVVLRLSAPTRRATFLSVSNQKAEQAASASGLLNLLSGIAVQVPINALNCNELNILSNENNR
jgi:hypothetical protein